ncbi:MAG: hypothetical protein P0Y60_07670 [Candidatus Microbacterium colombiense]|nr:MAG: hypothetical protein P0Y60_07670 [Microbacterium sp.]
MHDRICATVVQVFPDRATVPVSGGNRGRQVHRLTRDRSEESESRHDMKPSTSLRQEVTLLALAIVILIVFIPTAILTLQTPNAWVTGFIDIASWQAELPTWVTLAINLLLVLVAAVLAFVSAALLVRRFRTPRTPATDEAAS